MSTPRLAPGVRVTHISSKHAAQGRPLDLAGRVLGLTFHDSEKKATKVTLQLDNFDLSLFEREGLMEGALLEVSWGYADNMAPPRRVVVKKVKGFTQLTLEGHALSALMNEHKRTRQFAHVKRSDVARTVAQEHGYSDEFVYVQDTEETYEVIHQIGETDARLLRRLAVREGVEFWVDRGGLHWKKRPTRAAPTHRFEWIPNEAGAILSLQIETDLVKRPRRVTVKGRDPMTKQTIEHTATSDNVPRTTLLELVDPDTGALSMSTFEIDDAPDTGFGMSMFPQDDAGAPFAGDAFGMSVPGGDVDALSADDSLGMSVLGGDSEPHDVYPTAEATPARAKREARTRYRKAERATVKMTMRVVGDPTLRAKTIVEVLGISRVLSGKYYVTDAKHVLSSGGYTCELKLVRDALGRRARHLAARPRRRVPTTGADTNRHQTPAPGAPLELERVDGDTGMSYVEYRYDSFLDYAEATYIAPEDDFTPVDDGAPDVSFPEEP